MTRLLRHACYALALSLCMTLLLPSQVQAQTQLVKDIEVGSSPSNPDHFTVVGDLLFFEADEGAHNDALWVTDGTEAGTQLVKDVEPDGTPYFEDLTAYNGKLYFSAQTDDSGRELWVSDGTASGTHIVKEIGNPEGYSQYSGDVENLIVFDDRIFFSADRWKIVDGQYDTENELWVSDGTTNGTQLFKDLYPGTHEDFYGDKELNEASPRGFTVAGNQLFFTAQNENGRELWVSDGTPEGTEMVKDITPGLDQYDNPHSTSPYDLTAMDDKVFFEVKTDDAETEGLWVSDGTAEGTQRVKAYRGPSRGYGILYLTTYDGRVYFPIEDESGRELWASDGTEAGTERIAAMPSQTDDPRLNLGTVAGGLLFMNYAEDLWVTDGTEAGTRELETFDHGLNHLSAHEGRLYFAARKKYYSSYPDFTTEGTELWVSDGTPESTILAQDINPGGYTYNSSPENESHPEGGVVFDGRLFFSADDGTHGRELWVSDGAPVRLVELDPADLSPIEIPDLNFEIEFSSLDQEAELEVIRNFRAVSDALNLPDDQGLALSSTWTVELEGAGSFDADVCFALEDVTNDIDPALMNVYKRADEGEPWELLSSELRPTTSSPSQICATGVTGFSEFVITAEQSTLPVELASFEATRDGDAVRLTWQTASETANAGFEIQRSEAEDAWAKVAFVEGTGTTTEAQSYRFTDEALPFTAETVRYRLKQVDLDGSTEYSPEIEVAFAAPEAFILQGNFPNPFQDRTTIRYALPEAADVRLEVFDAVGRRVAVLVDERQEAGRKQVRFDASRLASGIYFLRLHADDTAETQQMVLAH